MGRNWSEEDDAYLIKNHILLSYAEMATYLGVDRGAVSGRFYRLRRNGWKSIGRKRPGPRKSKGKTYTFQAGVWMDEDMFKLVIAHRGNLSMSERLRELIEWGLEAERDVSKN